MLRYMPSLHLNPWIRGFSSVDFGFQAEPSDRPLCAAIPEIGGLGLVVVISFG